MAKAEKKFVYCFQRDLGFDPPFLAELVKATAQQATLKVGKKTLQANRAACSTTPYTQTDLDKFQPHASAHMTIDDTVKADVGQALKNAPAKAAMKKIGGFF